MIDKHEQIKENLLICSATAMNAELTVQSNITRFDTDSDPIGVDNRCSEYISHIPKDFIGDLTDSSRTIKGFAGSKTSGIKIDTLLWSWEDNAGMEHSFKIPNSYYVPQGKVQLFNPQHWAKYQCIKEKNNHRDYHGTLLQLSVKR